MRLQDVLKSVVRMSVVLMDSLGLSWHLVPQWLSVDGPTAPMRALLKTEGQAEPKVKDLDLQVLSLPMVLRFGS